MRDLLRFEWLRFRRCLTPWSCLVAFLGLVLLLGISAIRYDPRDADAAVHTMPYLVTLFTGLFTGYFYVDDVRSGMLRNVLQGPAARMRYVGAVYVCVALTAVGYVLVGLAAINVTQLVITGTCALVTMDGLALWALQLACVAIALNAGVVTVMLATGSTVLSVLAGFCSAYDLGGLALYRAVCGASPSFSGVGETLWNHMLAYGLTELGAGRTVPGAAMFVSAAVALTVFFLLSLFVMRRRDVCGHAE